MGESGVAPIKTGSKFNRSTFNDRMNGAGASCERGAAIYFGSIRSMAQITRIQIDMQARIPIDGEE